jgi:hypothetical protein
MKITWKDAISTISTAGAAVLGYADFNDYSWPLVSNINWVIAWMAALGLITLIAGFTFDKFSNEYWDLAGVTLAVALGTIAIMGWSFAVGGYVTAMLVGVVVSWAVSLSHHFAEHSTSKRLIHA